MGAQCTGCVGPNSKSHKHYDFEEFPPDIDEYSPINNPELPKIKFEGILCNIKICDSPKEALSMNFFIEDYLQVLLPRKTRTVDTHEIKWKQKEKFSILASSYDIRCKFLIIQALDEKGKLISNMKINLYMIATGPYHHDFCFNLGKTQARLQFDFKISQSIQTKIICSETEIQFLHKDYPGQSFNFSLSILKQENEDYLESNLSYTEKMPFDTCKQGPVFPNQLDECPSPIRIKRKTLSKPISTSRVSWHSRKGQMPICNLQLSSYEIGNSLIHFIIWKIDEQNNGSTIFIDQYISLNKILETSPQQIIEKTENMKYEKRKVSIIQEKLFKDGEAFAEYTLHLKFENLKYIKQMQACARTENGIIPMNPYIKNYGLKKSNRSGKLETLEDAIKKIQKMNIDLNKNISLNFLQKRQIKQEMIRHFQNIQKMLEDDLTSSFSMPSNQDEAKQTAQNQTILLSVLSKIYGYLQYEQIFSEVAWLIILGILKRGEFSLNNIGFKAKEQNQIKSSKRSKLIQKKIKNAITFQQILYKLFFLSLKIGYIEGRQSPNQVIQMFKAYCYFIIPEYREKLLRAIQKNEDPQIVEWKVQSVQRDEGAFKQEQNLILSIDWQDFFYRPLRNIQQSQNLVKQLVENLEGNKWLGQIGKRGPTFFYFVYFLVKRLNELGKKIKFIKWKYFPGYNKIVRSFLCEMKKKQITKYPKSMIQTSIHLLSNQKLSNIIVSIILQKTNIYDSKTIMKALELIGRYFDYLTEQKNLLPATFNYISFYKALKVILEGDFSYAIAKVLVIIYNHYLHFNADFRRNITMYLLGKAFFKLFLHWSFPVRSTFYHLLLLKIDRSADIFNPQNKKDFGSLHEVMTDISNRYEKVITVVRNAEIVRKNEAKKKIFRQQDKNYYEKMRRKMNNRFKLKNSTERSSSPANQNSLKERISQEFSIENYLISKLTRSDLDRSYSAIINMKKLTLLPSNKKKQVQRKQTMANQQQIQRITSDTNGQAHLKEIQDQRSNPGKQKKKRRLSIDGPDDFDIKEIEKQQLEYLAIGVKQYNSLEDAIKIYIVQNDELPVCELDKLEIPIDEKDLRPTNVQDWQ